MNFIGKTNIQAKEDYYFLPENTLLEVDGSHNLIKMHTKNA